MKKSAQRILFSLGIALAVVTHAFADLPAVTAAQAGEENMILIPADEFMMGSENRGPDEKPAHKVYLDAYYIGKYEVTNEEYYKFWKATGKHRKPKASVNEVNQQPPSPPFPLNKGGQGVVLRGTKALVSEANTPESFTDEYGIGTWPERALKFPRHPVVGVSWDDAVAYAEWVGMRLPTEAEWEKAARGTTDQLWPWGNSLQPYANHKTKSLVSLANTWNGNDGYDNGIAPVGSYPNGKSHYGVMDMAGNVWEWTSDWYSDTYYFHSPKQNPKGADTGSWRVIRGGAWTDDINRCATTFRFYFYPSLKTSFIGFRLAQTAETPSSSGKSKQK